jgi:transposase
MEDGVMGKKGKRPAAMEQINVDAAGIDVGATSHFVAVPEDRDDQPVREFASYTEDLYRLADWLTECGIKTVAMESTGVYWIPLFQVLEERGFEVRLVDARRVKNVSGRKTDVADCQWLQQLHTFGLLMSAFRPDDETCVLRSYVRQRDGLVAQAAEFIQHMQKALELMNVKLTEVLSDITGLTGMAIIDDIVAGKCDPHALAKHRHPRCKQDEQTIARALTGHYRQEHVFALRQAVTLYRHCQELIGECDSAIERFLEEHGPKGDGVPPSAPTHSTRASKNGLAFDAHGHLFRIAGVDLTAIPGLSAPSVLTVLSETGLDTKRWRSGKAFASWLGLCPNNRVSGGKVISSRSRPSSNRAAAAFRMAAYGLHRAKSALGAYFRRMKSKLGTPKAIVATAHKIARIFYSMLVTKKPFAELGQQEFERRYQARRLKGLAKAAQELGFQLVPAPTQ